MNHHKHGLPINMPYFLFRTLQTMTTLAQISKNPRDGISYHGLTMLLVEHALQKEGRTWNDVVRTPIVIPEDAMVALPAPWKERLQLYLQEIVSQLQ
jgi:hypothetical protein